MILRVQRWVGVTGMHPMHLHGHSFQVLKLGLPPVYPTGSVCAWPAVRCEPSIHVIDAS